MDRSEATGSRPAGRRSGIAPFVVAAVLGCALAAAPVVFQMFSRAPAGGDMIDDFEPYMTVDTIETFRGYLGLIGDADEQASTELVPILVGAGVLEPDQVAATYPAFDALHEQWPAIDADMSDLLDTMDDNLGNYDSVAALPPFALFPWFFVVPGLLAAAVALVAIAGGARRRRTAAMVLVVVGLGIAAAPAVFQMFSRAPDGAAMIDDFRPMMTQERVTRVQGYFITMGAAEGELRNRVVPAAQQAATEPVPTDDVERFADRWPVIVGEFAPMVATMSDNVDSFAGIDALPSFALFPWFFVVPGLLVAGSGWRATRVLRSLSQGARP